MAGVDSGIKVDQDCAKAIASMEKKENIILIMQIGKIGGKGAEKVLTRVALTPAQVKEAFAAKSYTYKETPESDEKVITIKPDEKAEEPETWCVFRHILAQFPIAYGAAFLDYQTKDGRPTDKLMYVTWNPDSAGVKDKMKYSSTKVLNKFTSTPLKHQASDADDITFKEIRSKISS